VVGPFGVSPLPGHFKAQSEGSTGNRRLQLWEGFVVARRRGPVLKRAGCCRRSRDGVFGHRGSSTRPRGFTRFTRSRPGAQAKGRGGAGHGDPWGGVPERKQGCVFQSSGWNGLKGSRFRRVSQIF